MGEKWEKISLFGTGPRPPPLRVRLVWFTPECDYCVHTCPNESHQGGKQTRVRYNQNKKRKCESILSLTWTKITGVKRTTARAKQTNLGPSKRRGLSLDHTEPWFSWFLVWKHFLDSSDFWPSYRKFWQAVVRIRKRTRGEEETKCFIIIIIIAAMTLICSFVLLRVFKLRSKATRWTDCTPTSDARPSINQPVTGIGTHS